MLAANKYIQYTIQLNRPQQKQANEQTKKGWEIRSMTWWRHCDVILFHPFDVNNNLQSDLWPTCNKKRRKESAECRK